MKAITQGLAEGSLKTDLPGRIVKQHLKIRPFFEDRDDLSVEFTVKVSSLPQDLSVQCNDGIKYHPADFTGPVGPAGMKMQQARIWKGRV